MLFPNITFDSFGPAAEARAAPSAGRLSPGGRRGGDDGLASENVRSGSLAHNWRKKSIMAALTSDARSC